MQEHEALITHFYSAFQKHDHETMITCYHPEVVFHDPVFGELKGKQAGAMWHMLCEAGKDLQITFDDVEADDQKGSVNWQAEYTFSRTGRKIHNKIAANFKFENSKIIAHTDSFDFWRWTRMALGASGILLGWSPLIQKPVGKMAARRLQAFTELHPEYQ